MILVTPEQMASIDYHTIQEEGLSSLVLMENAARSVLPLLPARGRVGILVGPGNNGGDGLVLARALHEQQRPVLVLRCTEGLSLDAKVQQDLAQLWGVPEVQAWSQLETEVERILTDCDAIVDALFGTGLCRPITGLMATIIDKVNRTGLPVLAIDIPSGIDGRTGQILGNCAIKAWRTVTFGHPKWGHRLHPGREHTGELFLTQPGFSPRSLALFPQVKLVDQKSTMALLPRSWPTMHKGDNGRILLCTGSKEYPGAGILSVLGALRGGGGLVTHWIPDECRESVLNWAPEVLLKSRSEPLDFHQLLFDSAVIGSGLGSEAARITECVLDNYSGPVVIDAESLPTILTTPKSRLSNAVLTPHPKELSKLLEISIETLERSRIDSALKAAEDLGCVLCFKGTPTVCAAPDGRAYVNSSGNAVLAQGGSGDILAGLIGAHLAFGLPPLESAAGAVYLHGLAADQAALTLGPRGIPAHLIAEQLPLASRQCVAKTSGSPPSVGNFRSERVP